MKMSKWNSDIGRVRNARIKQRAIRHNLRARRAPKKLANPTHRTQIAQMSGVLRNYRKHNASRFGAISFDQGAWQTDYNTASNLLDQINYTEVDLETVSFPIDDAPFNEPSDPWSVKVEDSEPSNKVLYNEAKFETELAIERGTISFETEADKANYIIALYKRKLMDKYGRLKKPFSQSTMQMVPPEEFVDERIVGALNKLREIAESRDNMTRALYTINQDIKFYEDEYATAASLFSDYDGAIRKMGCAGSPYPSDSEQHTCWTETLKTYKGNRTQQQAVRDNAQTQLMGGNGNVGLRDQAEQIARGLAALNNQYSALVSSVGIDPAEADARVAAARESKPGVWKFADTGTGILLGGVAVIGLVMLAQESQKKRGPRRQEGRDPIGIFINQ